MTRIGLLSDTHGLLDKRVLEHFRDVDEIWHAGDIGSAEVLQRLREFKPTRAVLGNMACYGKIFATEGVYFTKSSKQERPSHSRYGI